MANRNRLPCFVCLTVFRRNTLTRIDRDCDEAKRVIVLKQRNTLGRQNEEITDITRICIICNKAITSEIAMEANENALHLNVFFPMPYRHCIFCNAENNLLYLSLEARVDVYIKRNIFIPHGMQSCREHITERGLVARHLLAILHCTDRSYILPRRDLQAMLSFMREKCLNPWSEIGDFNLNEDEYKTLTSLTEQQFNELLSFCQPVPRHDSGFRYVEAKDLFCFLFKLRQGLPDECLKVIFKYSSRQTVSLVIRTVLDSLYIYFTPHNIGFSSITRHDYVQRHVTDFANELYNSFPDNRKAIVIIDGTYVYIDKSSNFQELRQSYCVHKHNHLVKPIMMVAPNGFILDIHVTYFSDSRNNDASILIDQMEKDEGEMRNWFEENDIVLVDRGYRDATPLLRELGIDCRMPSLLQVGQAQLSTEDANSSRFVTKCRWLVESRNGHIKSLFKFFDKTIEKAHVAQLRKFYRIAGTLINRYHLPIQMQDADVDLARQMLENSREPNIVQARVEAQNLRRARGGWIRLDGNHVQNFPRLSVVQLKELTFGTFQIKLSRSYIQDKVIRDNDDEFQIDQLIDEPGFIRVRIYSRFRNQKRHQLWIAFNEEADIAEEHEIGIHEIIYGYYCTCQSGARTVGCCCHVAAIIWFLSYARHVGNIKYPSDLLL